MNEDKENQLCEADKTEIIEIPDRDDRYPASFFRIPGPPMLGNIGWSLN
jgi:hypothetical protein